MFIGESGSGKTTYIQEIFSKNPKLRDSFELIDEHTTLKDFFKDLRKLCSKKKFFIASHVSPYLYFSLKIFGKVCLCITDKDRSKIEKYLRDKQFVFSPEIIKKYTEDYGSTYTDIDIILEHYEGNNFDEAFHYFQKTSRLERK